MDSTIISETQAFITKQREALLQQRETIFTQQQDLERQLDDVNGMLAKFDAFEGKPQTARASTSRRAAAGSRKGSKRDDILQAIKENPTGLTRGELLDKLGVKGDKSGEMSVSNALTALSKSNQVARKDGKYISAA